MIRVGTASWTDPTLLKTGWYPTAAKRGATERLRYYASVFDTVEVDSSYYALPTPEQTARWAEITPPGFVFHVKAYSALTGHGLDARALPKDLKPLLREGETEGRLSPTRVPKDLLNEAWHRYLEALRPLQAASKLGYLHFGLPPWAEPSPSNRQALKSWRERTAGHTVAIEFRNRAWYDQWPDTKALLQELDFAHVTVDAPRVPVAPPTVPEPTGPIGVLRCHGRNGDSWSAKGKAASDRFNWDYSDDEIDELTGLALRIG
ncbi:MAG TPA: DUF72 domain-containing protein, partial [Deinococcales bacterium]|nr:DUF72 domain-containing protein [Deinococcales bacterium]